MKGLGAMADYS